ncbi:MAG: zf-HC2 domain-containing protein [Desulfobacterales bacterium]|jgi:hypothetical protein
MDCRKIKEMIPIYLDHELDADEHRLVAAHLRICPNCQAEAHAMEKSWEMLGELDEIKPDPRYITRFWRTLDAQTSWYEKILRDLRIVFLQRRWVPVFAGVAVIVLASGILTFHFLQSNRAVSVLTELNEAELEMVTNFDLAENYEIIRDIDFYSDIEIIENLDEFEIS